MDHRRAAHGDRLALGHLLRLGALDERRHPRALRRREHQKRQRARQAEQNRAQAFQLSAQQRRRRGHAQQHEQRAEPPPLRLDLPGDEPARYEHRQRLHVPKTDGQHAAHHARAQQRLLRPADIGVLERQIQRQRAADGLAPGQRQHARDERRAHRHHAQGTRLAVELVPPLHGERRAAVEHAQRARRDGRQQRCGDGIHARDARERKGTQLAQRHRRRHCQPALPPGPQPGAQPEQHADGQLPAAQQRARAIADHEARHHAEKRRRHAASQPQQHGEHRRLAGIAAAGELRCREHGHHPRAQQPRHRRARVAQRVGDAREQRLPWRRSPRLRRAHALLPRMHRHGLLCHTAIPSIQKLESLYSVSCPRAVAAGRER